MWEGTPATNDQLQQPLASLSPAPTGAPAASSGSSGAAASSGRGSAGTDGRPSLPGSVGEGEASGTPSIAAGGGAGGAGVPPVVPALVPGIRKVAQVRHVELVKCLLTKCTSWLLLPVLACCGDDLRVHVHICRACSQLQLQLYGGCWASADVLLTPADTWNMALPAASARLPSSLSWLWVRSTPWPSRPCGALPCLKTARSTTA
jgi:hypothetical protein